MAKPNVELSFDSSEVRDSLRKLIDTGLPEAIKKGLVHACIIIQDKAVDNIKSGNSGIRVRSGQLWRSFRIEVDLKESAGYVCNDAEYAPYVELGTGIYAKNGDGRKTPWVYCDDKGNYHKTAGRRATPFLEPAALESKDDVMKAFENLL